MNKKVAVITGAASGLGWALTQSYLAQDYFVVMVDIQEELLKQREEQLEKEDVSSYRLDITDEMAVNDFIAHCDEHYPRIDVLINNAGITHRSLVSRTRYDVFKKVMFVDYLGPVQLTTGLLGSLKKTQGSIVNVGSMAGWMPVLGRAGYCAAKSALAQFFEVLRCEIKPDKVHILMVYPSFLDTPIEQNALDGNGKKAQHKRSMIGSMKSADWMAEKIYKSQQQRRDRLFPDLFTATSALLYRLLPKVYLPLMTRKFSVEMEQK